MSCSKPLPPFTHDVLCYLNRDQLEHFSIVCRPLKNFIERYFRSKPCRVFDLLYIRGGSCALINNGVQWHPKRYYVTLFLTGQKTARNANRSWNDPTYYSFAEMRPYLGQTVRIMETTINVAGDSTYNHELIEEMESLAYLWRDGEISIYDAREDGRRLIAEDFQLILNSPTILQCRLLKMDNANLSFKDYHVLYTVNVIETRFYFQDEIDLWLQYWQQFLEQPGAKPVVVFHYFRRENVDYLLDQFSKAFSSAVSPNTFKIVFYQRKEPLIEFRETNTTLGEILELKKGLPAELNGSRLN